MCGNISNLSQKCYTFSLQVGTIGVHVILKISEQKRTIMNIYLFYFFIVCTLPCYAMGVDYVLPRDWDKVPKILAVTIYSPHPDNNFYTPYLHCEILHDSAGEGSVMREINNTLQRFRLKREVNNTLQNLRSEKTEPLKNVATSPVNDDVDSCSDEAVPETDNEIITYSMGPISGTCTPEQLNAKLYGKKGVIQQGLRALQSSPYKRRLNIFYSTKKPQHGALHELFPTKHLVPFHTMLTMKKTAEDPNDQGVRFSLSPKDYYCVEDIQDVLMSKLKEYGVGKKGKLDMDQETRCTVHLASTDEESPCSITHEFTGRMGNAMQGVESRVKESVARILALKAKN